MFLVQIYRIYIVIFIRQYTLHMG